ncbi:MAG: helix-turn-helix domain-containing protein [Burkholderiaceae bacterium]
MKSENSLASPRVLGHYTTLEVASMLGLAVRSVQLLVDRQELQAWKTPGGHRRISRESVERWIQTRAAGGTQARRMPAEPTRRANAAADMPSPRVLLIEDSVHFQNLVALLMRQRFPQVDLQIAHDGISGLAMYGQFQPDVLIVDILLPGIDGATLITTLRTHPQFARSRLVVVTSLDAAQREPYAFALQGVTVIHRPQLVAELPAALAASLAPRTPAVA